ncbi:Putative ABC transporter ATP-binding protein (plasmid) [Lactococcus piscium MKFS47]|uniref:Putative ABC transporter ATP-binding protein n=3 Tax=Streptococcaceae TaxID=1300 RepID=A0A0D6E0C9_9LACT|nr:Putative ABC transporter ATP-binding protein [Lactococcus piscium MKFS47]
MKLENLFIEKLHGIYNYDVDFNEDITFLYGSNGCGKTTILNIVTSIVTGKIYELFFYDFKIIKLKYSNNDNVDVIEIKRKQDDKNRLKIIFEGRNETISKLDNLNFQSSRRKILLKEYFHENNILKDISRLFNYVYLPLSRSAYVDPIRSSRKNFWIEEEEIEEELYVTKDASLTRVQELIVNKILTINNEVNRLNNNFRDKILKTSINIYSEKKNFSDMMNEIENSNEEKILEIQESYLNIMTNLKLINEREIEKYNNFFSSYIKKYEQITDENDGKVKHFPINLVLQYSEISKIRKVVELAQQMEKDKKQAEKPLELFCSTLNSFLSRPGDIDSKNIIIETIGQPGVYFKIPNNQNKLSVQKLSSGEKQLIIFFANLIFGVNDRKNGIFIVDEPELSLHLTWQKLFIEQTLKINNNIQLIFATHSPEIVGRHRDKMYKLEKVLGE